MISLEHVYKSYSTFEPCLKDINFEVRKGEFIFILGPSGSGKTTLFKMLSAYEPSTSGRVKVLGHDLNELKSGQIPFLRRKLGFVLQNYKLLKNKTVFENIELPLIILNESVEQRKLKVDELIKRVGLSHVQEQFPDVLSGGEQQRVAIARALVHSPEILIADEPTGNLDYELSLSILNLFKESSQNGLTVLFATHDRRLIEQHPTARVFQIQKGHLIEGLSK